MNSSLSKLSLPHMCLHYTKRNGSALYKIIQVNRSLTHLDLSRNVQISDSGARCIFEGLQHNTTLVNLNLSQTGVSVSDPDTARSLTKMLQVNKSLTHLDLSKNTLSDSGAHSIFEGLRYNTSLVNLTLSNTGIAVLNMDTARSLTKMLQVNKSLTHLDLSNHDLSYAHQMIMCIFEGLKHNSTLRYLNLHAAAGITVIMAEHIAEALQLNCTLQTLDISECSFIERNGIDLILQSLIFNSTLQTLYISDIDSETLSTFKKAREAKDLPPIDIAMNDSYPAAEVDFTVVTEHIKQQGSVDVHLLKSYPIGPPGVGKSATRHRLTGEIDHLSPDETDASTGIDAPLTVQLWKRQGLSEQCLAQCSCIFNITIQ